MPAVKNGNNIDVSGSPNTLSSITSDINDTSWIEESPAGTFTIKARHLNILGGGVATIGDEQDFSMWEKLVMQPAINDVCRIDIQRGGELQMFGNTEIDGNSMTPLYYQRWRWMGKFYCRGNATYRPYIYHEYVIWHQRYSFAKDGFDRNHDVNDIDYLRVDTPWSSASKWSQPTNGRVFADYGAEIIKNAIFGKVGDAAWRIVEITQAQARNCGDDASKHIWEDCTFLNMGTAFYMNPYHLYLKNCVFEASTSYSVVVSNPFTTPNKSMSEETLYRDMDVQLMFFLDGCSFINPVYTTDVSVEYGGQLLIRGCTFNASAVGVYCLNGGRLFVWTGNTFNGTLPINRLATNSDSQVFWVHSLDLTINDKGGSPLKDAMIYIKQKDGKERWLFKTDVNGKPINMASLQGKIILVHKEQLDNVPNFTLWSDAGNSTYHEVWVWKEGYEPVKMTHVMSADRNQTVYLEDALTAPDVRDTVLFGLGLTGELDLPAVGDVEKGVQYDSATKTGTFKPPAEADVRNGEGYGAGDVEFTGQLDLPDVGDVEKGVQYDSTTKTGTFKVPLENIVKKSEQYGKDDVEFTGTLEVGAIIVSQNLTGRLQRKTNLKGRLRGG